jgi:hypothetical protein
MLCVLPVQDLQYYFRTSTSHAFSFCSTSEIYPPLDSDFSVDLSLNISLLEDLDLSFDARPEIEF